MNKRKIPSKYLMLFFVMLLLCLILPMLLLTLQAKAEDTIPSEKEDKIIAPALQYMREDYPSAFLLKDDYSIKLNTARKYKLRCSKNISAVAIGDIENVKASENDETDEEKMLYELAAPKDIIIKTRQETYTYMQIYTDEEKPVTVMMSINCKNEVPSLIRFGDCTMFEDIN